MRQLPTPGSISEAVLLTLSYLDAVGLPATTFDVWQHLIRYNAPYREVRAALERTPVADLVTQHLGFWSLRDEAHIEDHLERQKRSEDHFRRARRIAALLAWVPHVSSVSVCNSVALNTATQHSDVDLFITVAPGRLWLTRLLVTGLTSLARRRRHHGHVAGRVCLSFYATDDALTLRPLSIDPDAEHPSDLYLAHWIMSLAPIWSARGARSIIDANQWTRALFPQRIVSGISRRRQLSRGAVTVPRPFQRLAQKMLSRRLGAWLERKARSFQLRWMHKAAPFELKTDTQHIVINDQILKFHEEDRRVWFHDKTIATYERLITGARVHESEREGADDLPQRTPLGLTIQPVGATVTVSR